jgi:hypothetical protein
MSSGVVCPNSSFRIPVVLFASAIIIAFFQWNITSLCLKISYLVVIWVKSCLGFFVTPNNLNQRKFLRERTF